MKLEHAEHNLKICDEILAKGTHNDWVLTTAFYSSIHFIDHFLFPGKFYGVVYGDINTVHDALRCKSRHLTRSMLVELNMPKLTSSYRFLEGRCRNARYIDYRVDPNTAKKAREMLERIAIQCRCKPIPSEGEST